MADEQPREISRVAFKAPPFWKANPELWFRQIESQFITANITVDATKFHCVVSVMESEVLSQVSDVVIHPPADNMYNALKERLIERFADSEAKRLKKLLQDLDLGDKKPSHLLREMRDLASSKVSDEFLKSLWLQRLPTQTQVILSVSTDDLNKLAAMADKICEVVDYSPNLSAVSQHMESAEPSSITKLETQIAALTAKIENMDRSRSRTRSPFPVQQRKFRSTSRESDWMCWYHRKFGQKAQKCNTPCKFNRGNEPAHH